MPVFTGMTAKMFKKQKVLNGPFWILNFGFAGFGLFRISIFGFRVLLQRCLLAGSENEGKFSSLKNNTLMRCAQSK
jgi:hypothetical protein